MLQNISQPNFGKQILTVPSSEAQMNKNLDCFGPYTTANARKLGMNVCIVSRDYSSFGGFAEAIAEFFTLTSNSH